MTHTNDTTMTTFRALIDGDVTILANVELHEVDKYGDGPGAMANGDYVGCGSLDPAQSFEQADAVGIHTLLGSDYSGGAVVRANLRVFDELMESANAEHDADVVPFLRVTGGHGTQGVVMLLDRPAPDEALSPFVDLFRGLCDYPVASEDELCDVEREEEDEAWTRYACQDFRQAIADGDDDDDLLDKLELVADDDLRGLFHLMAERGNLNGGPGVVHECEGPHFMVSEAAAHLTDPEELADFLADPAAFLRTAR